MKKMDRSMMLIMALALMLALLTACGSSKADGETAEDAVGSSASAETGQQTGTDGIADPAAPETTEAADIGIDAVQRIVLAKVPGATADDIYELEWEYDDGRLEYEGSIYYNGYEYEFEVDGATGNILQWEIDD